MYLQTYLALATSHRNFLAVKQQEEKAFVRQAMNKKVELGLDGLVKFLIDYHQNKNFRGCLKVLLLYILKVDQLPEGPEKAKRIAEIVSLLEDEKFIKELLFIGRELNDKTTGADRDSMKKEATSLLGLVCFWFTRPELATKATEVFWKTLMDALAHFIASDFSDVLLSLNTIHSKQSMPENIKKLIFSTMKLKSEKKRANDPETLRTLQGLARRCLLIYPHSENIRTLYNDVMMFSGNVRSLILTANEEGKKIPISFSAEFRVMDMFRNPGEGATNFNKRASAVKIAILQAPHKPLARVLLSSLEKESKDNKKDKAARSVDSEKVFEFCKKEKHRLMTEVLGSKDPAEKTFTQSVCGLWYKAGSSDLKKSNAIKRITAIDNLILVLLMSNPPKSAQADLRSLQERFSKIVLDNTIVEKVYFSTYLHYLYQKKEFDQMQAWIEALSYLKLSGEVQLAVNYSLMVKTIRDIQSHQDDSAESKELVKELEKFYTEECPVDEFKESAACLGLMFSKHISKDKGNLEVSQEAANLIAQNPEKFKSILSKYVTP